MGRLMSIFGILALIAALSVAGIYYAADTRDRLYTDIDAAIIACEKDDMEILTEKSKAMSTLVKERHGVLSLYVRHDEIEKLENLLIKLEGYAKTEDVDDAAVTLMEARFMAEHIWLREMPSAHNIF